MNYLLQIDTSTIEALLNVKQISIGGIIILAFYFLYTQLKTAEKKIEDLTKQLQELNFKMLDMQKEFTRQYQDSQKDVIEVINEMKEVIKENSRIIQESIKINEKLSSRN